MDAIRFATSPLFQERCACVPTMRKVCVDVRITFVGGRNRGVSIKCLCKLSSPGRYICEGRVIAVLSIFVPIGDANRFPSDASWGYGNCEV